MIRGILTGLLSCLLPLSVPALDTAEAVRLYYEGDLVGGILEFEKILQSDPGNPAAREELVQLYRETGDYDGAIRILGESWRHGTGNPEAERQLFLSLCLSGRGDLASALLPLAGETAETVFHEALLYRDEGDTGKAAALLRKSLALEDRNPMAWFFLGEILLPSSPAEAESCLRTALRQDAGLTAALHPLGEAIYAQGRNVEAYGFFARARNIAPDHPGISARLEEIRKTLPEVVEKQAVSTAKRRDTAVPPRVPAPDSDLSKMPLVRVGLAEKLASVTLKTGGDYTLRAAAGLPAAALPAAALPTAAEGRREGRALEILQVTSADGEIIVRDGSGDRVFSSRGPAILEYGDPGDTSLVFDFLSEEGSFFAVTEDRAYRGRMEFRPERGGITLINTLGIEEYLYAVLPSEMPASWPAEALKAQAVAARSYTLAYLGTHASRGFDLYGSVLSAAYRGVLGEAKAATAAVDATRGTYMQAGGKPLRAYYSANHGGYSEDSRSVWGSDAYMAAVPDKLTQPRDGYLSVGGLARWIGGKPPSYSAVDRLHSPVAYRWEKWVRTEEIASRISGEGSIGDILRILTRGRGISGRVYEVEIIGTEGTLRIRGDRIRSRLGGLRSNLFMVNPRLARDGRPEYFIFRGAGWGHGVGLDQSGAAGMASAGFTAGEILQHYYPKAEPARY